MATCKLCKEDKSLIKKSHIIPEFLYKEHYDENHKLRKFDAIEKAKGIENTSRPSQGEYDSGLLCSDCDNKRIGQFESYLGKIINNSEVPEEQKSICKKIVNDSGVEFTQIENIDYKSLKLGLLSILWRASISKRPAFKEVGLGPYEEKIRKQIYDENPSNDNDIPILVMSWRNDEESAKDIIGQPRKHRKHGKTHYSIVLNGYIVIYYISDNAIKEELKYFRLKEDNTLSIFYLPKGKGMEFLVDYTGATAELNKQK